MKEQLMVRLIPKIHNNYAFLVNICEEGPKSQTWWRGRTECFLDSDCYARKRLSKIILLNPWLY